MWKKYIEIVQYGNKIAFEFILDNYEIINNGEDFNYC